jgi:hypothetical protein
MGYALAVYSVPHKALLAVRGSKDKALLDRIWTDCPHTGPVDELIDGRNARREEQIEVKFRDAVRQLLYGGPLEGAPGFVYCYALEGICWALGRWLDNDEVPGFHFEELDDFLTEQGVPLTIQQLAFGGPPIPLPEPDDFPGIGCWTPELIQAGAVALKQLNRDGVPDYLLASIETIDSWLAHAIDQAGNCLVGFVY